MNECTGITVIGGMISDPPDTARTECARYAHTNLGDPRSYPGLWESAELLASRISKLIFSKEYAWAITSGATETNFLALYYWKRKGARNVIVFPGAHYSVRKAAQILDLKLKVIENFNINKLKDNINKNDLIVVTIGTTEEGLVDPINELLEAIGYSGVNIHVDAAFAGLISRWLPTPIQLQLDGAIRTYAVDLHKLGEAPMPLGMFFASNWDIINSLYFEAPYVPSGRQFGLLGSRPGCSVFAALKALDFLENYFGSIRGMAIRLMDAAIELVNDLSTHGFFVDRIVTPIICIKHENISKIIEYLRKRKIMVYTCNNGRGIRMAIMPHHLYKNQLSCIRDYLIKASKRSEHGG